MPKDKKVLSKASVFVSILMLFVLLGVFIGTLVFCNMENSDFYGLSKLTDSFISKRNGQTLGQIFSSSLFSSSFILITCMLLGFSAIGQPFTVFLLIFRGIGLGATISYIYCAYGIKGFFIAFLIIMPNAVLSSVAVIVGARESIRYGTVISAYIFTGENLCDKKMKNSAFKLYLLKFLILFVIIIISSFMDAVLTVSFGKLLL